MKIEWHESEPGLFLGSLSHGHRLAIFFCGKRRLWIVSRFNITGEETILPLQFIRLDDATKYANDEYEKLK
jgi:hypothetical protein